MQELRQSCLTHAILYPTIQVVASVLPMILTRLLPVFLVFYIKKRSALKHLMLCNTKSHRFQTNYALSNILFI